MKRNREGEPQPTRKEISVDEFCDLVKNTKNSQIIIDTVREASQDSTVTCWLDENGKPQFQIDRFGARAFANRKFGRRSRQR